MIVVDDGFPNFLQVIANVYISLGLQHDIILWLGRWNNFQIADTSDICRITSTEKREKKNIGSIIIELHNYYNIYI